MTILPLEIPPLDSTICQQLFSWVVIKEEVFHLINVDDHSEHITMLSTTRHGEVHTSVACRVMFCQRKVDNLRDGQGILGKSSAPVDALIYPSNNGFLHVVDDCLITETFLSILLKLGMLRDSVNFELHMKGYGGPRSETISILCMKPQL